MQQAYKQKQLPAATTSTAQGVLQGLCISSNPPAMQLRLALTIFCICLRGECCA